MSYLNCTKQLLLIYFVFLSVAGFGRATQKIAQLDSLKKELQNATDSLQVAKLCLEINNQSKYHLLVQNPDEGPNLIRALRIYESHEKWNKVASIYNELGGIYQNRFDATKARMYWNISKDYFVKIGNINGQIKLHNNLSCSYFHDTTAYSHNQIKLHLDSAISFGLSINDSSTLISPYQNLGDWYRRRSNYVSAEKYCLLSNQLAKKYGRQSAAQSTTFQLGIIKKELGFTQEAINILENAFMQNAMISTQPIYLNALLALSDLYSSIGDYKNGYVYRTKYQQVRDTLYHSEQAKALLNMEIAYETEKREKIILEKDNKILMMEAENQVREKMYWIVGAVLFLLFAGSFAYRSYRFVLKEKSLEEAYSRKLLTSHEDERKRISMDLHDSVGQSLMLIKNKIVLDQDKETVSMVSQALEEVRSISKALHPVLLEKLGLTASIQKLVADCDEKTEIFFSEEIENIDSVFTKDEELHIFRIVQESINNIVKHAQTPSATVTVSSSNNKVTVQVKDFGVGFDLTDQNGTANSLGMKTLKERTQILGGKMIIDSVKNQGTTILLEIPKHST